MANDRNTIGIKLVAETDSFNQAMKTTKDNVKQLTANFKNSVAGMENWNKTSDGLNKKIKSLSDIAGQYSIQMSKIKDEIKRLESAEGDHTKEIEKKQKQLQAVNTEYNNVLGQLDSYTKKLNEVKEAENKQNSAYGKLLSSIQKQKDSVSALEEEYKNAVVQYGKNSKEAKELAIKLQDANKALKDTQNSAKVAEDALEDLGNTSQKTSKKISALETAAVGAVAAGMYKLGQGMVSASKEIDDGSKIIVKATGATGDSLNGLMNVAKDVFSNTELSFNEVAEAIGEINTRLGLTGDPLKKTTDQYLKFAKVVGQDVKTSVQKNTQILNSWGFKLKDTSAILDKLVVATQVSGISIEDLQSSLVENSGLFQQFGYSIDEAISMLMSLNKAGVSTDKVLNGMKKSFSESAKAGTNAREDWDTLTDSIVNSTLTIDQYQLAVKLLGKNFAEVQTALQNGNVSFSNYTKELKNSKSALDKTAIAATTTADDFEQLKHEMTLALVEMAKAFKPVIKELMPAFKDFMKWISEHGKTTAIVITSIGTAILSIKGASVIQGMAIAFNELAAAATAAQVATATATTGAFASGGLLAAGGGALAGKLAAAGTAIAPYAAALAPALIISGDTATSKLNEFAKQINDANSQLNQAVTEYAKNLAKTYNITNEAIEQHVIELYKQIAAEKGIKGSLEYTTDIPGNAKRIAEAVTQVNKELTILPPIIYRISDADKELLKRAQEIIESLGIEKENFRSLEETEQSIFESLKKTYEDNTKTLKEAFEKNLITQEQYNNAKLKMEQELANKEKELAEQAAELEKKRNQERIESIQRVFSNILEYVEPIASQMSSLLDSIIDLIAGNWETEIEKIEDELEKVTNLYEEQTEKINEEKEKQQKVIDANAEKELKDLDAKYANMEISVADFYKEKERIEAEQAMKTAENAQKEADALALVNEQKEKQEEELAKKKNELEEKQFIANKANSIVQATIDGAKAIMNIWATNAGNPILAGILTALATSTTGVQIATISKQQYVPALAKGGIVDTATLAMVGEAGKEAIMPLENNTGWIDELAEKLNQQHATSNFTQIINAPKMPSRRELYRDTKNLLILKGV